MKPRTKEQVMACKYCTWAGNQTGVPYKDNQCDWEVWPDYGWIPHPCSRKNGHGINGLYCKQHTKINNA